jgi:hypothetical protein
MTMHTVALILDDTVVGLAVWDGVSAWNPVGAGLCSTTVDVTNDPAVQVGSGYSGPTGSLVTGGTFTAPPPPAPTPAPGAFLTAIFNDSTLPMAFRLAAAPWLPVLTANMSNPALITQAWQALAAQYSLTSAQQTTVAGYATTYAIPGI